jgi:prephenate dehydrogenase
MPRLAIIGLGLIGGSLGLALKAAQLDALEIAGYDREWGLSGRARRQGAIDRDARSPEEAVAEAAVVVIATPIAQIKQTFQEIAPALAEGAVVTDTASTKRDVLRWAQELLPDTASFVGGHPIAGKERSGLDAAEAALFQGRPWAVIPTTSAAGEAIRAVENLVRIAGAMPVLVDAAEHDSYMAAISHLPLIAATALFSLNSESKAWPELASLSGPGFRDATRLASTNPDLSHDICLTNQENLLHWLDRYIEELRRYRLLVAEGGEREELYRQFVSVQTARDAFLAKPPEHPSGSEGAESFSAGQAMLQFMVGEYVMRRTKEIEQLVERGERPAEPPKKDLS